VHTILGKPDYLASIVEIESGGVVAARQVGERRQGPMLPNGRQALQVSAEFAKVFTVRIGHESFGKNRCHATGVRPARIAVEPAGSVPRSVMWPRYQRKAVWDRPPAWVAVAAPPDTSPALLMPIHSYKPRPACRGR